MPQRKPVGPAGRGPRRKYYVQDFENWTHAVCGRLLPEGYLDVNTETPGSTGPKTPKNPGNPPGQGPGKQGPIPPAPPSPPSS